MWHLRQGLYPTSVLHLELPWARYELCQVIVLSGLQKTLPNVSGGPEKVTFDFPWVKADKAENSQEKIKLGKTHGTE